MPVTYKNKGNKIYYLHHEKTKTGKPRYYFSMKDEGNLMEKIPEGYEIGFDSTEDKKKFFVTESGIVVIPKNYIIKT